MREAISISEAAQAAGFSRSMLYELIANGDGPATFTVGRRRLVRVETLREWLAGLEARAEKDNGHDG